MLTAFFQQVDIKKNNINIPIIAATIMHPTLSVCKKHPSLGLTTIGGVVGILVCLLESSGLIG